MNRISGANADINGYGSLIVSGRIVGSDSRTGSPRALTVCLMGIRLYVSSIMARKPQSSAGYSSNTITGPSPRQIRRVVQHVRGHVLQSLPERQLERLHHEQPDDDDEAADHHVLGEGLAALVLEKAPHTSTCTSLNIM